MHNLTNPELVGLALVIAAGLIYAFIEDAGLVCRYAMATFPNAGSPGFDSTDDEPTTQPPRIIRVMQPGRDFKDVYQIERLATAEPRSAEDFNELIHDGFGLVCLSGNLIQGFLVYDHQIGGREIVAMAVLPDAQRLGIGRELLGLLKARIEVQADLKFIDVRFPCVNETAGEFFTRQGFAIRSTMDGEAALRWNATNPKPTED